MTEIKSRFRYVKRVCTGKPPDPNCPVAQGAEFSAVPWNQTDQYRVFQSRSDVYPDAPSVGQWFAACEICHSHKLVEKLD